MHLIVFVMIEMLRMNENKPFLTDARRSLMTSRRQNKSPVHTHHSHTENTHIQVIIKYGLIQRTDSRFPKLFSKASSFSLNVRLKQSICDIVLIQDEVMIHITGLEI